MHIRAMTDHDATAVLAIYQAGIDAGGATFETRAPDWDTFTTTHLSRHRFVADIGGRVAGWIAAAPASTRTVYAGVIEHSVYVADHARGQGVASSLLAALIDSSEADGIWTIQAGIFCDNTASLALHDKHGFRILGVRHRIARTACGTWRDVVLLERRSTTVGVLEQALPGHGPLPLQQPPFTVQAAAVAGQPTA